MDQVLSEPFRLDCPLFADELVGRDGFEGLQPAPEVVVADEVAEVTSQLIVVVVVKAFHGGLLDRAVQPPDLAAILDLVAIPENSPPRLFSDPHGSRGARSDARSRPGRRCARRRI